MMKKDTNYIYLIFYFMVLTTALTSGYVFAYKESRFGGMICFICLLFLGIIRTQENLIDLKRKENEGDAQKTGYARYHLIRSIGLLLAAGSVLLLLILLWGNLN
ncbi:MAG: hypothetical protein LBU99_05050 [Spirochaetaceae bacterium]|jgi:uncharacterized membrane protein|nr:hypothetical protein [Spirochaetaceae bacterium]